jgi:hypothetical protein
MYRLMFGLVTVFAAAAAAATAAPAAKCVPGCYALAINEEMPRRLQVSRVQPAGTALLQHLALCFRVALCWRRYKQFYCSQMVVQFASSTVA